MNTLGKTTLYLIFVISLALLSHISGFKIGAVKSFNWDIALMLTPYGIIKNTLLSETYLTSYYDLVQKAQPLENAVPLYILLILNTALGLLALHQFLRSK